MLKQAIHHLNIHFQTSMHLKLFHWQQGRSIPSHDRDNKPPLSVVRSDLVLLDRQTPRWRPKWWQCTALFFEKAPQKIILSLLYLKEWLNADKEMFFTTSEKKKLAGSKETLWNKRNSRRPQLIRTEMFTVALHESCCLTATLVTKYHWW